MYADDIAIFGRLKVVAHCSLLVGVSREASGVCVENVDEGERERAGDSVVALKRRLLKIRIYLFLRHRSFLTQTLVCFISACCSISASCESILNTIWDHVT